jgi:hypothetical protein
MTTECVTLETEIVTSEVGATLIEVVELAQQGPPGPPGATSLIDSDWGLITSTATPVHLDYGSLA